MLRVSSHGAESNLVLLRTTKFAEFLNGLSRVRPKIPDRNEAVHSGRFSRAQDNKNTEFGVFVIIELLLDRNRSCVGGGEVVMKSPYSFFIELEGP